LLSLKQDANTTERVITMASHWKKNILKTPDNIIEQIKKLQDKNVVAASVIKIKTEDILNGDFNHLDIKIVDGNLKYPEHILPRPDVGHYSKYNLYGHEIVHRELPMITKGYSNDLPNFGDWDKGSHDVTRYRDVYQREYIGPKYLEIKIELVGIDDKNNHVFKFAVDDILDQTNPSFQDDLFFDLNLLQENTGNHGVYSVDADANEYLRSLYVSWEILPPGEIEQNIARILTGIKSSDPKLRKKLVDRYKFLSSMKPRNFVQGTSRFQRYFGAQFSDDLVVFENVQYGNAIYVMFQNWEELSKVSRGDLLSSATQEFIRVRHTKTWKLKLRRVIKEELKKRTA
jgi:hypothetical protein